MFASVKQEKPFIALLNERIKKRAELFYLLHAMTEQINCLSALTKLAFFSNKRKSLSGKAIYVLDVTAALV